MDSRAPGLLLFYITVICLAQVIGAEEDLVRSPRQALQVGLDLARRPNGVGAGQFMQYYDGTSPFSRGGGRFGLKNRCKMPERGVIGLNLAFPEVSAIATVNFTFDAFGDSDQDDSCEYVPEMDMTAPQLIRSKGYPAQTHWVVTEDGYILEIHRIPKYGAPPVLIQHGILYSSVGWVLAGPGKALAYTLSDAGYDVWLGNYRGNHYSRRNIFVSPENPVFWDFSFHEMGLYDLPAEIDYILKLTKYGQLSYVGFSMGCTGFFIMCSLRPEYNGKIRQMQALAPVVFVDAVRTPLRKLYPFMRNYQSLELLPNNEFVRAFGQQFCREESRSRFICNNILFLLSGYDSHQLNETMLPLLFAHTPAGSSFKALSHYCQISHSGRFRQYDYELQRNLEIYGSAVPPDYDLSKVTCPVYLHYGENDWINHPINSWRLMMALPNCRGRFKVPYAKFNHMDFVYAIDAKTLLYDKVVRLMDD